MFSRRFIQGLRQANVCRINAARIPQPVAIKQRSIISQRPSLAVRHYSGKATIDEIIEDIQEQYATAKDEFEIAFEETEKRTTYAEEDRKAAREELDKLHKQYQKAINGPDKEMGEEIQKRIGQRIRELDAAVKNLEELAMTQD